MTTQLPGNSHLFGLGLQEEIRLLTYHRFRPLHPITTKVKVRLVIKIYGGHCIASWSGGIPRYISTTSIVSHHSDFYAQQSIMSTTAISIFNHQSIISITTIDNFDHQLKTSTVAIDFWITSREVIPLLTDMASHKNEFECNVHHGFVVWS